MNAKDALKIAEIAIDHLDVIQDLTKFAGAGASAALASISHIVGILKAGVDGKVAAADVARELAELRTRLAANDTAADTALDKKFRGGDGS